MSEAGLANDAAKTNAFLGPIKPRLERSPARVLVVGCGSGCEAGILARALGAETYGIDIGAEFSFDHVAARPATLRLMDAQALEFDDSSFDLVYSFHALEHIPNFCEALREMSRVLRLGGTFCIGTPNKARFLGYLGSSAPLRQRSSGTSSIFPNAPAGAGATSRARMPASMPQSWRNHRIDHFGEAKEITDDHYPAPL